ncbi:hypothetical protein [uncultured Jatrophihabitans sp.]|uniref:hypothetical protein n=1 Tax=uncultured Jatrophihabitans sp. TaxID=1610747 RepID=UPI0035CC83DC
MPRSRGVVSGVLLLLAGVWAAFVPFVGPAFHFAYTPKPNETWHWTAARGWYEVLPGALAVFGGLLLILSASRIVTSIGAWLAALAGGWLVVGQQVSYLLKLGSPGTPSAAGDRRYVAEYLAFFTGIGALIILLAAVAIGRLSVRSVRDVRAAQRRDEQVAQLDRDAAEQQAAERAEYERANADRDVTDRNAQTWAAGNREGGYGTPGTTEPLPVAGPDDDTAAMPVVAEDEVHTAPSPADPGPERVSDPGPQRVPDPEPSSGSATVWNPEAQSPTTTGELPAVGSTSPPSAAPESPRRGVHMPRRYFGSSNPAPQEQPVAQEQPAPPRDAVRTDEAEDLNDLDDFRDLDERSR